MDEDNKKNPIENALGLGPLPDPIRQMKDEMNDNSALTDFNTSRANIQTILTVGSNAINELGVLASQSQDADAYLALSNLIKNVSDASVKLMTIHENLETLNNKKAIKNNKLGDGESNTINLFFSTSELFKAIKENDGK